MHPFAHAELSFEEFQTKLKNFTYAFEDMVAAEYEELNQKELQDEQLKNLLREKQSILLSFRPIRTLLESAPLTRMIQRDHDDYVSSRSDEALASSRYLSKHVKAQINHWAGISPGGF